MLAHVWQYGGKPVGIPAPTKWEAEKAFKRWYSPRRRLASDPMPMTAIYTGTMLPEQWREYKIGWEAMFYKNRKPTYSNCRCNACMRHFNPFSERG